MRKLNGPITSWSELETNKSYEEAKLVFDGEVYQGRAGVDVGKMWEKPNNVKVICIDATACFIKKSTPFEFYYGRTA